MEELLNAFEKEDLSGFGIVDGEEAISAEEAAPENEDKGQDVPTDSNTEVPAEEEATTHTGDNGEEGCVQEETEKETESKEVE